MASIKYGKGLVGLLKQGWGEIPEVMLASGYAIIGFAGGCYAVHCARKYQASRKKYRFQYTVYRDDDPKLPDVRRYGPVN